MPDICELGGKTDSFKRDELPGYMIDAVVYHGAGRASDFARASDEAVAAAFLSTAHALRRHSLIDPVTGGQEKETQMEKYFRMALTEIVERRPTGGYPESSPFAPIAKALAELDGDYKKQTGEFHDTYHMTAAVRDLPPPKTDFLRDDARTNLVYCSRSDERRNPFKPG